MAFKVGFLSRCFKGPTVFEVVHAYCIKTMKIVIFDILIFIPTTDFTMTDLISLKNNMVGTLLANKNIK